MPFPFCINDDRFVAYHRYTDSHYIFSQSGKQTNIEICGPDDALKGSYFVEPVYAFEILAKVMRNHRSIPIG